MSAHNVWFLYYCRLCEHDLNSFFGGMNLVTDLLWQTFFISDNNNGYDNCQLNYETEVVPTINKCGERKKKKSCDEEIFWRACNNGNNAIIICRVYVYLTKVKFRGTVPHCYYCHLI